MAHDPKGYTPPYGNPRPMSGERLASLRAQFDPGAELELTRERRARTLLEWIESDPVLAVDAVRDLLEHGDALQAELDRIDRGLDEALETG